MRIVNMAHGNLYAIGAYVAAWAIGLASSELHVSLLFVLLITGALAAALAGAIIEPMFLRPLYRRAEEYQLLMTFGLLLVLEDVMRLLWGPHPLTASALSDALGSISVLGATYPTYNIFVIVVGALAAVGLGAFVYRTRFGVMLRATSQDMRMASALGINVKRVYVQAFTLGCLMAGLGGAVGTPIPGAVLAMGADALILAVVASPFQTITICYGLVFAIAALGFSLLLGYTGLLSFGHSAYFGTGAYVVALLVKYLGVASMELFVVAGILGSVVVAAVIGVVCVRYTRIFFGILTLALSQVLWSLALKLFWVTGGSDGLRVPTPTLLGGLGGPGADKVEFIAHRYYYYVLILFLVATAAMWVIVSSPFGKALQAIRDNETRAEFVGVQVWKYRWIAFVISGAFTGLAGALWVPLNGLTTPDILYWPFSGRIVFFTVF